MFPRRLSLTGLFLCVAAGVQALTGPVPLGWRWFAEAGFAPTAKPTLSDGLVVVPVGRRVYALDAGTGYQRWMFPPGGEPDGDFRTSVVASGDVFVACNTNRFVYAVDKKTGRRAWDMLLSRAVVRTAVATDDVVFLFTTDNRIVALNSSDGKRAWSQDYQIGDNVIGKPLLYQGKLIFFTARGQLLALNTATKRIAWSQRVLSVNSDGGPVAFENSIFIVTGSQVVRLNPVSGAVQWVLRFPAQLAGGPAVTRNGGIVATSSTEIYTFALNGRSHSREPTELKGYLTGSPQSAGDNVFVRTRNGTIYLLDPERGDDPVIWEYTTLPIAGTMRVTTASTGGGGGGSGGLYGGGGGGGGARSTTTTESPADYVAVLGPLAISDRAVYALAEDASLFAWGAALGVDEIGPTVVMMSPPMGSAMSGRPDLDLLFRIEDQGTGIMTRSIRVTMNGRDMKSEYKSAGGFLYVRIRRPGSTTPGANPPLTDGRKMIRISVADWAGNVTENTFSLIIDNTLPVVRERTVDERRGTGSGGGPSIG
ncbi:MAG: PQQ-like beta-propeller repeat protein [Armatimonadetes bacterium]|nr:PQQ-like beta-propeller repeat protein [Armatimonadota bacterium]